MLNLKQKRLCKSMKERIPKNHKNEPHCLILIYVFLLFPFPELHPFVMKNTAVVQV